MCHVSFQPSLPVEYLDQKASECWSENSRSVHYYAEPSTTAVSLDDSLQYSANDGYLDEHGRNDDHTQHQPPEEPLRFSDGIITGWSFENDGDGIQGIASYPSADTIDTKMTDLPPEDNGSELHSLFNLPGPQSPQDLHDSEISGPDIFPQGTQLASTTFEIPSLSHPSLFESHSSTFKPPSQRDVRPLSKISPSTQHQFVLPESVTKEYYGSDPMPPRLLTSGMVRRVPSRQPIKSLDLDLDLSKTSKRALPRLQTNDRAAALTRGREIDAVSRRCPPPPDSASAVSKRSVRGVEDLMSFHSKQSETEGRKEGGTLTYSRPFTSRVSRQKVYTVHVILVQTKKMFVFLCFKETSFK